MKNLTKEIKDIIANCTFTINSDNATDSQIGNSVRLKRRCKDALIMVNLKLDNEIIWEYINNGEAKSKIETACKQLAEQLDENISYKPTEIVSMLRTKGLLTADVIGRKMECAVSVFHSYEGTKDGIKCYGAGVYYSNEKVAEFLNNY